MTDFPISPPPELFAEWFADSLKTLDRKVSEDDRGTTGLIAGAVAIQAARWGSDQELEACCEWLETGPYGFSIEATAPSMTKRLRAARRPKPPSLKEQALTELNLTADPEGAELSPTQVELIRRALESLPS